MLHRYGPNIFSGLIAASAAALLAVLGEPVWLIFFAVFLIIIVSALVIEALRDPVTHTESETLLEHSQPLPEGFGRSLLEQMPLSLMVISNNGRVVYRNQAAKKLLPKLLEGEHFASQFRAPVFVDAVNSALQQGITGTVSFSIGQDDERYFDARIGLLPAGSEFGELEQAIVEIEDRTKDRRTEIMRTDFIANASHELRTPLASILGYIETLQHHAKDDPAAREKFLNIMSKQATRMQRLVDDLMSLSRIEMNVHMRPETQCDLHEVAHETVSALMPLQEKYGVELMENIGLPGPNILGDRDQLNQVFINLLDNAMKYCGEGGKVEVIVAEPDGRYEDYYGLSILDNGPGIAPEHIRRLTERFYRVNVAQSRNKGGTGLGLAIVKHIIHRHEGHLRIESKLGSGSKFTVWFPKPSKR